MDTTFTSMKCEVYVERMKVDEAVSFYEEAFGAEELSSTTQLRRNANDFPWLVSTEIQIGSICINVTDVHDYQRRNLTKYYDDDEVVLGRAVFCLGTSDVKAAVDKAVMAGAIDYNEGPLLREHEVKLLDPYGNVWVIKRVPNNMATQVSNGDENTVMFTWAKRRVYVEEMKVDEAVAFYQKGFGAERLTSTLTQVKRHANPPESRRLVSTEIQIGSLCIIVTDADYNDTNIDNEFDDDYNYDDWVKTRLVVFCLETSDVKAAVDKAVKAGAVIFSERIPKVVGPFVGRHEVKVKDPYGIVWVISKATRLRS